MQQPTREKGEVIYAFVPVGRRPDASGVSPLHVRLGRKAKPGDWKFAFHGLNAVEKTLMEVRVRDARAAMGRLVEFLRGNAFFGPEQRQLGGWHEGRLQEETGFGHYWWVSTYSMRELSEIFALIAWELGGREGPAPGSGRPEASAVAVQQAGPGEVLIGPVSSATAAHLVCGTETGRAFLRDKLCSGC
jgi:hypothetical protein